MRVLICDPISERALEFLSKNNIDISYKPQISVKELISEIYDFDAIMVRSRTKVTIEVIRKGKKLKTIARIGSGFDNIDINECRKHNIVILNAPEANSQSVAELTITLIISLLRKVELGFVSMKKGLWLKNEIWGHELFGKTVGVFGYGFVGQKVAELLKAFSCKLLIYSLNYKNCDLTELFSNSDIVTIHLTLNNSTKGIIDINLLSKMKKNAYLVNISRGEIINEEDLYDLLKNEKIAGAALDVFWNEPLPKDSKWRKLPNVVLTPHLGAATVDALDRAGMIVAEDIVRIKNSENPKYKVL